MTTRIQLRRDPAATWTSNNPVLAAGELGVETDTGKFKLGNGSSGWASLSYSSGIQGTTGTQGTQGIQGTTGPQGTSGSTYVAPTIGTTSITSGGTFTSIQGLALYTSSLYTPTIDNIKMGYTTTATAAGTTTLTASSNFRQLFTGSTTQTVVLPVTSTLVTGVSFEIENNASGNLTVNSSGGNLVATVVPGLTLMVTCIGTSLTTAADWDADFIGFSTVSGTGANVLGTAPTISNLTLTGTLTAAATAGTSGQVLQSTGTGIQWATPAAGAAFSEFMLIGA